MSPPEVLIGLVALALIALVGVYTLVAKVPPTPTSRRVRQAMFDLLPADQSGTILELGSGWGHLAMALARRYPQARVIGYERSPVPWLASRLWLLARPQPNLTLEWADFRRVSLEAASLIVCYLFPGHMGWLADRLGSCSRPGVRVLSNTFALPGWRPTASANADDLYRSTVLLYRIPDSLPPPANAPRRSTATPPLTVPPSVDTHGSAPFVDNTRT